MKVITERDKIREVLARWSNQYARYPIGDEKHLVTAGLRTLDLETCSANSVNKIIGNDSWTTLRCNECDENKTAIVEIGQEPDYESMTAYVCKDCIAAAGRLFE